MSKIAILLGALLVCGIAQTAGAQEAYFTAAGAPVSTLVRVSYPDSSARFQPEPDVAEILADAKDASVVYVSGRTSTARPSARDEVLAFARAAAARKYLVDRGVSPLKIMVNYASATDFVADNSTPGGRLENQRVDIELVYVPMY
jgi:hypothetical protein